MAPKKNLKVGIIGPAGMTGSYAAVEFLNRGHSVLGISRNPKAVGTHERYTAIPLDFDKSSISQIAKAFEGLDVLVKQSLILNLLMEVHTDLIPAGLVRYSTCHLSKPLVKSC